MNKILSYIFKGLIALLPIIILFWLIKIVFDVFSGIIHYIFSSTSGSVVATIVICVLVAVFFFSIGFIVERKKEAIILKITELIIGKIPVVASIYSTLKEAVNLFSGKSVGGYLGVVFVELNGYKMMGFITKELEDSYWIFVPTTPNPTSGFLINAKKDAVEKSDLSVANGFKKLVSLGIK